MNSTKTFIIFCTLIGMPPLTNIVNGGLSIRTGVGLLYERYWDRVFSILISSSSGAVLVVLVVILVVVLVHAAHVLEFASRSTNLASDTAPSRQGSCGLETKAKD